MGERLYREQPFPSVGEAIAELKSAFPGIYATPWWGTKRTSGIRGGGSIHNLGFVIGFRDDSKHSRYRLDYDPNSNKQLHINFERDLPGEGKEGVCFLVKPSIIHPGDEMWNYYCTWTTQHCDSAPDAVRSKLGEGKIWRGKFWA